MSLNMQINDDDTIRYLMREMDPSEEIEFERKMLSDQNLLIEVESLRSTLNKVKKLPLQNPPPNIIAEIQQKAIKEQRKNIKASNWMGKSIAVAASLVLIATASIYFYNMSTIPQNPSELSEIKGSSMVKPWIDKNEIIRVADRADANRAKVIGLDYEKSYEKLVPVHSVETSSTQRQGVLLTRSVQKGQ